MQQKYDPCAANPYFARHKYLGIPIDRNIAPVNECKLHHYVGPAATLARGIAVHILTPEHLWASFQAEAEQIVTVDGRLTGNDEERNKRINAAYARLWLADRRFQWAGLAAFASKQVGCGLLHAGGWWQRIGASANGSGARLPRRRRPGSSMPPCCRRVLRWARTR